MAWKLAVGVPVQSSCDADVRIVLKALTTAGLRPPCTKSQSRHPIQSAKYEPPHMHSAWASRSSGEVPLGEQADSMLTISWHGGTTGVVTLGRQTEFTVGGGHEYGAG